jgi:putative hydrolase of the HAD superfamily
VIRHLLFDLDNTLYSSSSAIDHAISERMIAYVALVTGMTHEEARQLRSERLPHFATTLEWLQQDYDFRDYDAYFAFVHPPEEVNEVDFDPDLRPFLQSLGYPMSVLTNAPAIHSERLLRFFNIDDLFLGVYDVTSNGLRGKPHESAYRNALVGSGFTLDETVFFDDLPKYVAGYRHLGGTAILVNDDPAAIARIPEAPHIASIYELPGILRNFNHEPHEPHER